METTIEYARKEMLAQEQVSQPKWQRITLLSVLGYEGLGALAGGLLLIMSPGGRIL